MRRIPTLTIVAVVLALTFGLAVFAIGLTQSRGVDEGSRRGPKNDWEAACMARDLEPLMRARLGCPTQ